MNEETFFDSFGQSDKDVFEAINAKGDIDAKCEMAVNFGYVWFPAKKVWVNKNADFTPKEETLFNKLRKKYGV